MDKSPSVEDWTETRSGPHVHPSERTHKKPIVAEKCPSQAPASKFDPLHDQSNRGQFFPLLLLIAQLSSADAVIDAVIDLLNAGRKNDLHVLLRALTMAEGCEEGERVGTL